MCKQTKHIINTQANKQEYIQTEYTAYFIMNIKPGILLQRRKHVNGEGEQKHPKKVDCQQKNEAKGNAGPTRHCCSVTKTTIKQAIWSTFIFNKKYTYIKNKRTKTKKECFKSSRVKK